MRFAQNSPNPGIVNLLSLSASQLFRAAVGSGGQGGNDVVLPLVASISGLTPIAVPQIAAAPVSSTGNNNVVQLQTASVSAMTASGDGPLNSSSERESKANAGEAVHSKPSAEQGRVVVSAGHALTMTSSSPQATYSLDSVAYSASAPAQAANIQKESERRDQTGDQSAAGAPSVNLLQRIFDQDAQSGAQQALGPIQLASLLPVNHGVSAVGLLPTPIVDVSAAVQTSQQALEAASQADSGGDQQASLQVPDTSQNVAVGGAESQTTSCENTSDAGDTAQEAALVEFSAEFRHRRDQLGYTQQQVADCIGFSQTTVCRFEKLDLSTRNMSKMKPILERWLSEAEQKTGVEADAKNPVAATAGSPEADHARKRRTPLSKKARDKLEQHFERQQKPTSQELHIIANCLGLLGPRGKETVRVWFCNRRQREKRVKATL